MSEPHLDRRRQLAAVLLDRGLDAALVTMGVNVTYLTGLSSSNAACLVLADETTLLATDDRYAEAAAALCPEIEVLTARQVVTALAHRGAARGGTVGIERHHLTLADGDALTAALDGRMQVVDLDQAVEHLRAVKEEAEVDLVAQACALSVAALSEVLAGEFAGRTERALARDLEARMLMLGADGLAFDTIVASGPNGSVPHHSPTDRVIEAGDLVTIDFGAMVGGYHADCTRTVLVAGPAAAWQHEIYDLVREAQRAGVAALAPGESVAAIDATARGRIADAGFGEFFVHGLGHGVGLQIHEPPWLMGGASQAGTLPSRATVTVEPGIYIPGKGGVRIEDTTDVGPAGVLVLTDLTTDLVVVHT